MTDKKKSGTQYLELFGEFEWAQVFEQNRDKDGPNGAWKDFGGKTKITVILDDDQLEKFKKTKSQKKVKVGEDGRSRIQFDRKWEAPYNYGGAPQVVHADGTPWDLEEDGLIGNGSKGVVYLSLYETGGYTGTRLNGVQVIEHVPYETDYVPSEGNGGIPFKDYSKQAGSKSKSKAKTKTKTEELDDEIPFD